MSKVIYELKDIQNNIGKYSKDATQIGEKEVKYGKNKTFTQKENLANLLNNESKRIKSISDLIKGSITNK